MSNKKYGAHTQKKKNGSILIWNEEIYKSLSFIVFPQVTNYQFYSAFLNFSN